MGYWLVSKNQTKGGSSDSLVSWVKIFIDDGLAPIWSQDIWNHYDDVDLTLYLRK